MAGGGAGTGPVPEGGEGGGALAIGRRPEHPARSSAAKNEAINQPERKSDAGQADRRSLTPGTAIFEQLQ